MFVQGQKAIDQSTEQLGASHKGSTITELVGSVVRYGNLVTFTCYWAGSATNLQPILTLPTGYRPSSRATAIGIITKNGKEYNTDYSVSTDGTVLQNLTTAACTDGRMTCSCLI